MRTIHKFRLNRYSALAEYRETPLKLPAGSVVVSVNNQHGEPHVWVMLDKDQPYNTMHRFVTLATGAEVPDGYWPCGSILEENGALVWHVLWKLEAPAHG